MPHRSREDRNAPRMRIDLKITTLALEHRRRDRIGVPSSNVINSGDGGDAMLVPRMIAARTIHDRPADQGPRASHLGDHLVELLHSWISPLEEVLPRFPSADVDRSSPSTTISLHPSEDDLLERRTQLRDDVVIDDRLRSAA